MLIFLLEVIVVSIFVSLFAAWIKLIPAYPKWKYRLIQQGSNTGILTVVLTLLFIFEIYLSWLPLFGLILVVLTLSVILANSVVRNDEASAAVKAAEIEGSGR